MSDPFSFLDTEFEEVRFGKYAGYLWSQVPSSYLWWMMKKEHSAMRFAYNELKRRKEIKG